MPMTPAEAAVRFRIEWDTSALKAQGAAVNKIQDRMIEGQLGVARAVSAQYTQTESDMEAMAASAQKTRSRMRQTGAWFNSEETVKELQTVDERLKYLSTSLEDVSVLMDPDNQYPPEITERAERNLEITESQKKAGWFILKNNYRINALLNGQWVKAIGIHKIFAQIQEKSAKWGENINNTLNDLIDISATSASLAATMRADKLTSDMRGLRKEGGLTADEIQRLPSLFAELINKYGGRIDREVLKPMAIRSGELGTKGLENYRKVLDAAVYSKIALGLEEVQSVEMAEKLLNLYKQTEDQITSLMGQIQYFAGEGRLSSKELGEALLDNQALVYQLDQPYRFEGMRQLTALMSGLSNIDVPVSEVENIIKTMQRADIGEATGFFSWLGLDKLAIRDEAQAGEYAKAMSRVIAGIRNKLQDAIQREDKHQELMLKLNMEKYFNMSEDVVNKIMGVGPKIDLMEFLSGSKDIKGALLGSERDAHNAWIKIKSLLGGFVSFYGETFQPLYGMIANLFYDVTKWLSDMWTPIAKWKKDIIHLGLALFPIYSFWKRHQLLLKIGTHLYGLLDKAILKMFGVHVKELVLFDKIKAAWTAIQIKAAGYLTSIKQIRLATISMYATAILPWVVAVGVISVAAYMIYKWFKKFKDLGGFDHIAEGIENARGVMRLFQKDSHQGMLAATARAKETLNWIHILVNKVSTAMDATPWWLDWIFPPLAFLKAGLRQFDKLLTEWAPKFQRIEDFAVGLYLVWKDKWDKIKGVVSDTWEMIRIFGGWLKGWVSFAVNWWGEAFGKMGAWVSSFMNKLYESQPWLKEVASAFESFWNVVKKFFGNLFQIFKDTIWNSLPVRIFRSIAEFFGGSAEKIEERGREYRESREQYGLPLHAPIPPAPVPATPWQLERGGGLIPAIDSDELIKSVVGAERPVGAASVQIPPNIGAASVQIPPNNIDELIRQASQRHGVDERLLRAVVRQESSFDPEAISDAGARGLMQLMPRTAREVAAQAGFENFQIEDLNNAAINIELGTRYLKQQLEKFGNVPEALAAYNAGPSAVVEYGGIPPYEETRGYVRSIMSELRTAAAPVPPHKPEVIVEGNEESLTELTKIRIAIEKIESKSRLQHFPSVSSRMENTANAPIIDRVAALGM